LRESEQLAMKKGDYSVEDDQTIAFYP
jgi:hypothetical protein